MQKRGKILILGTLLVAACVGANDDNNRSIDSDSEDTDAPDTETSTNDKSGPIHQDCSDCSGVGDSMENFLCAFDICEMSQVEYVNYYSPTASNIAGTIAATAHFGFSTNDLAPLLNDSYTLIATGPATGTSHSQDMSGLWGTDLFANDEYSGVKTYNEMEWEITFVAPQEAQGFGFKYVFFSEEYDDFISSIYNDKFYVFIEADSTNGGAKTVINFTNCREPNLYFDFICPTGQTGCEQGERYCYIAINSALSDCCWYAGCPDGYSYDVGTDISGTGYECAASEGVDGDFRGSSTGWLQTTWPIEPGETFTITFHIHDTGDGYFDSEVILDSFQFLYDQTVPETVPVE